VLTDEIYEYFIYEGQSHVSPATIPGHGGTHDHDFRVLQDLQHDRLAGRVPGRQQQVDPAIGYFHDLQYVCTPSPFQYAAAAGLRALPDSFYQGLATEYQEKRDQICDALTAAGLDPCSARRGLLCAGRCQPD
jgi:aminotransferase